MMSSSVQQSAEEFLLKEAVARRHAVEIDSVVLYQEFEQFLAGLFKSLDLSKSHVAAVLPVMAEVPMAADRAETKLVEVESTLPFAADIESIKRNINSPSDIIYLANPNRLTGATFSLSQLKTLASLVEQGLLIIDEYYHEFSQLSALPLAGEFSNVVMLRPFQDWGSTVHSECGYAVMSGGLISRIASTHSGFNLGRLNAKKCLEIFDGREAGNFQVKIIQKRAFEIAIKLMEMGVKSQFTPTDSILMHLSNALEVMAYLKARDIRVERIGESEILRSCLRYRITCSDKDKELIKAVLTMSQLTKKIRYKHSRTRSMFVHKGRETFKSTSK